MLSIEELRRFCLANTKRGQRKFIRDGKREFSVGAFIRTIGWESRHFYDWMHKKGMMPSRVQKTMSRFVELWDAGTIGFTPYEQSKRVHVVHFATPRAPRTRLAVDIGPAGARLQILGRRKASERLPPFPDVAGLTGPVEK